MLFSADDHLLVGAADLNDVQRRARGDAESLALSDREVVNAPVLADYFAVRGDEVTGGVGQGFALLGEVGVDEALVVAAGNEANLLRVGLFRQRQALLARQFANLGLLHFAQREESAAQLLLGQAEKKIRLILAVIGGTLEQPSPASLVKATRA